MEELNCETVFKIPLFGGIGVSESTVVTWIIIAALTILSIIFVRNLKVENPGKIQLALESLFGWLQDFFDGIMGENGRRYVPYMITVILYIAVANLIGLLGFKPPTKDMNVTAGLAIMSIVLVEFAAIRARGTKGWLKKFMEPMAVVLPINILELFTRPLSLCMRLFGNVLGSFVIMELIKMLVPLLVPIPFNCYFDIFDGLIQAYVFVFLTALYVGEAVE
ncbi:F0F1 ATP synthase subunit A [Hespellia stercorisuis]|uniref:ATP synthase subunit a n=1 Tax=Hespellia stercorisuis DSM 15480 TaxID=1121950 RepID=A0A1M6J0A4_9FIRM|nr:F0F1 ATP synthase subunit A [Hespellia stercorisuis]SHJ40128.1 ATP synthase F0 subcomplex A subunit [Hespellia stercorisuis DSM 15480]